LAISKVRRLQTKVLSRANSAANRPPTRPRSSAGASVAKCIWIDCTTCTKTAAVVGVSSDNSQEHRLFNKSSQSYAASLAMWDHSATCHPTQVNAPGLIPYQRCRYSINIPRRDERLSWPRWLLLRDGVPAEDSHPSKYNGPRFS